MLPKVDEIRLALDGVITPEQLLKMKIIFQHFDALEFCKSNLESLVLSLAEPYAEERSLVSTVPGIKTPFSVIAIISEIGVDMSVFPNTCVLGLA
jgi:transposase